MAAILDEISSEPIPSRLASLPSGASIKNTFAHSTPRAPVAALASTLRIAAISAGARFGCAGCEALPSVTKITWIAARSRVRSASVPPHPKVSSSGCGATTRADLMASLGRDRLRARIAARVDRLTTRLRRSRPLGESDHPSVKMPVILETRLWLECDVGKGAVNCRLPRVVCSSSCARTERWPQRQLQTIEKWQ